MVVPYPQTRDFQTFRANIEYARNMVVAGQSLAAFQSPVIDVGDFYRAAWVQAVGAIDQWFHEELYRRVSMLVGQDSPTMPYQLTKFELPLDMVEAWNHGRTAMTDQTLKKQYTGHHRAPEQDCRLGGSPSRSPRPSNGRSRHVALVRFERRTNVTR